jgi:hypothetical protein
VDANPPLLFFAKAGVEFHAAGGFRMRDLTSPVWIKAKGMLFLFLGIASGALLIVEHPTLRAVVLLLVAVWSFCRFYYFCFYVIEHYVDAQYRFSGVVSAVRYLLTKRT